MQKYYLRLHPEKTSALDFEMDRQDAEEHELFGDASGHHHQAGEHARRRKRFQAREERMQRMYREVAGRKTTTPAVRLSGVASRAGEEEMEVEREDQEGREKEKEDSAGGAQGQQRVKRPLRFAEGTLVLPGRRRAARTRSPQGGGILQRVGSFHTSVKGPPGCAVTQQRLLFSHGYVFVWW